MQKRLFFTTLFIVFGLMFSLAQTAQEVNEILPGKWRFSYAISLEGERMEFQEELSVYITFNKDGRAFASAMGEYEEMRWEYNERKKVLTITESGNKDTYKFNKFTTTLIEMELKKEKGAVIGLKKVKAE